MIDKIYIDELRDLDKKEAKDKLADYASTYNIVLKKTKSFDNMLADLKEEMAKLAAEPMPEDQSGLSISDLIAADDELSGISIFKDEASEEAKLLFDSPSELPEVLEQKAITTFNEPVINAPFIPDIQLSAPIGDTVTIATTEGLVTVASQTLSEEDIPKLKEVVEKIIETEKALKVEPFELPEGFSPTLISIGKAPGYVTLPWWIYSWILENPDWKSRPNSFPHHYGIDTLLSLIYYINRDGQVRIRETRNSRFFVLN